MIPTNPSEEKLVKWIVERYRQDVLQDKNVKILWGSRSIYKKDWILLKRFIKEYNIKTVLEYGSGLSTELMLLEGLEVICLEQNPFWGGHCQKVLKNKIIIYKDELPKIDRHFDLALVDGPQSGGRKPESLHAIEHADYIWFHDMDTIRRPVVEEVTKDLELLEDWGKQKQLYRNKKLDRTLRPC